MNQYTININDLSELIDGLNNAMIAYNDVIGAIQFNCSVSSKYEKLMDLPEEKLRMRFKSVENLYTQLLGYENNTWHCNRMII